MQALRQLLSSFIVKISLDFYRIPPVASKILRANSNQGNYNFPDPSRNFKNVRQGKYVNASARTSISQKEKYQLP